MYVNQGTVVSPNVTPMAMGTSAGDESVANNDLPSYEDVAVTGGKKNAGGYERL